MMKKKSVKEDGKFSVDERSYIMVMEVGMRVSGRLIFDEGDEQ